MDHFVLDRVGERVWAAIAIPDRGAAGNAAVVDLGGRTLVFDSHLTQAAAAQLRRAAERVAPVEALILSHWHLDHVLGAGAFAGVRVVSSVPTLQLIETRARPRLRELQDTVDTWIPAESARLHELGKHAEAELWERLAAEELGAVCLPHVSEPFSDFREFAGNGGEATLLTYGGGHTEDDAFLWLEDERVLITADLVVSNEHPWVGDGSVEAWRTIIHRLAALNPLAIVPGHGQVSGPDALDFMLDYLDCVSTADPDAAAPRRFTNLANKELWRRNIAALAAGPGRDAEIEGSAP